MAEQCSWCATTVEADDGLRAADPSNDRSAVFCRLEHVVPWAIQGAQWQAGLPPAPDSTGETIGSCARCGVALGDDRVVIVRHRGRHRIADGFCGVEHLLEWAKAGGRYGVTGV
ncbi:MAG TPA: hypothetical protein VNT22_01785 [Baekduia sp.]|nr:hypothetical protein [Baekduia sp.]